MHEIKIGMGVNIVIGHEPAQRGAVGPVIILLHFARRRILKPKQGADIFTHAPVNLVKQRAIGRVQRVVKVEGPSFNMAGRWQGVCRHAPRVAWDMPAGKRVAL